MPSYPSQSLPSGIPGFTRSIVDDLFEDYKIDLKSKGIDYIKTHLDCLETDITIENLELDPNNFIDPNKFLNVYKNNAFEKGYITNNVWVDFRDFIINTEKDKLMML